MTQVPPTTLTQDHTSPERGRTLADRLQGGEEFVVTFGGQGTDWFGTLAELLEEEPETSRLAELVEESSRRLQPVARDVAAALPRPFEPQQWLDADERPAADELTQAALGLPGVLLTQLTTLDLLATEGLDLTRISPVSAVGHSQGILGVAAFAGRREQANDGDRNSDVELLAIARLIGAAVTIAARRSRLVPHGEDSPMLAVTGATPTEVAALAEAAAKGGDPEDRATLAVVNGPRHTVVSGSPDALRRFRTAVEKRAAAEAAEIEAKTRGGRAFDPTVESIPVAVGFHHPALAPAVDDGPHLGRGLWSGRRPGRAPRPRHLRRDRRLAPRAQRRHRRRDPLRGRPRPGRALRQPDRSRPAWPRDHRHPRRDREGPRRALHRRRRGAYGGRLVDVRPPPDRPR